MLLTKRVRSEEKREEYLELICRESERLSALVENVLDFAALEGGKRKYLLEQRDVVDVVSRAIDAFRIRLEREGVELSLEVASEVPKVALDEQAVLLAVVNLLDNAVKYGEGTAVEVIVDTVPHAVRVRVRDHGPGIPREDLKRVFERFYRARRRQREVRGSGIGLSLVKHIAEAHGGRAWAENAKEGGAIVGFSLPIPKRVTRPERREKAAEVSETPASSA
jgi:two-component system phosphate regulon sensor histidine kinase PhoR